MEISIYSLIVWFAAILVGSIALVIYLGSDKLSSKAFALCILLDTAWITTEGFIITSIDYTNAIFYVRLAYYLGSLIASAFLYFFITFPHDTKPKKSLVACLIILEAFFLYIFLFTNSIISSIYRIPSSSSWGWNFGPLSILFEMFFFSFFSIGIIILYRKYRMEKAENVKTNLRYMLIAVITGIVPPGLMSIILFRFGYFDLNWAGAVTQIIWIPIIAYSIIKYRQMDVRAVATEVLAIAMSAIFFINIFIDSPFGIWGRISAFLAFVILAYFLIRGILRENQQREQLVNLNFSLESKVAEQTLEIRKSYEAEKHARLELEKLNDAKDQFIMITQHHLRTPINKILWELDESLKGTYGALNIKLSKVLRDTQSSGERLMRIVNDFLNITTIKIGTNILSISKISLKPVIEDILEELSSNIESMHLTVNIPQNKESWPIISVDESKIRESLFIIMENAVRYNKDEGSVTIITALRKNDSVLADKSKNVKNFEIVIENTGLGISPEESEKIGSALFYRGEYARKAYPIGMGVGLSVVKAIIRAHHGTFGIESGGKDTGAKVTVNLPL